ncbi:MAG TPA: glycosyl hydrolase 108 family protein [Dissulfurispiraceae bacterium]|nr:glycosyl hydrolase 108 family protein [Dissulfurispiraceae bacterium]
MTYRAARVEKTAESATTQKQTRQAPTKKQKLSFDDAFTAAFKRMDDAQPALARLEHMRIDFGKDVFNPAAAVPAHKKGPTSAASTGMQSGSDFRAVMKVVMKHEGITYVKLDGGKAPSKMGILQSTARQYGYSGDIKNITKAQAEAIYKKMWEQSGASTLSYPLSVIHFDTFVNSPAAARKILKQSGGDIDAYLRIREQRYVRLASIKPERYGRYLNGWMNRVNDLRIIVAEYSRNKPSEQTQIAKAESAKTTS